MLRKRNSRCDNELPSLPANTNYILQFILDMYIWYLAMIYFGLGTICDIILLAFTTAARNAIATRTDLPVRHSGKQYVSLI